jgi:signal transduction histidine kinase
MAVPAQNERLAAGLRLAVATAALAIFLVDPSEHPTRRPFATGTLGAFAAYSAASYLLSARRGRRVRSSLAPWIDVAWVTLAVAVSQATSEIFYPLYLFAILCASFWGGFRSGLAVAIASAVAFAVVGMGTAPHGIDLRLFLFRPLYLLVLGYLIAVWGGHEVRSRARLALLRDVTALSSPRFAVEPTLGRILEAVRAFFDADSCRVVVDDERTRRRWTRASVRGRGPDSAATDLPPELGDVLLAAPADATLLARAGRSGGAARVEPGTGALAPASSLLTALEAGALLSVPFRYHATAAGRMFVARKASRPFDRGDADFLRHLVDQTVPVLENLRLVDQLADDAATGERRRIALDLHDTVIQPYLGLRLGLSAAQAALAGGRADEARAHVERLLQLADGELEALRGYVGTLRAEEDGKGAGLEASVRRFCRRFSEATGIRVDVAIAGAGAGDRVAAEVFQMVAEGLSNVRRHTGATRAEVHVEVAGGQLRLVIANDAASPEPRAFFPRSLAERAAALGGKVSVQHVAPGTTAVRVEVPL